MVANILLLIDPELMPGAAVIFSVAFLVLFQFLSPTIQRNIFAAGWIDDFKKPDVTFTVGAPERADRFENLKLSPREKEVAKLLLRGLSMRQIAGTLGVMESTVKGYCKTLYKKLGINSRTELFTRFGLAAGDQPDDSFDADPK